MTIQNLLNKCDYAYENKDFEKLIKLCDEVFKKDPDNETAITYKSLSYCFLNQPEKALKIIENAGKFYPNNYHHKNASAMAYYDLGEYEKSVKCCDEGLNIEESEWLYENKIKALLKQDKIDEAMDCYENGPWCVEIIDLLIETGKYSEAMKYCLEQYPEGYETFIDEIKQKNRKAAGEYYLSWIYKIKSKSNIRFCSECGGELIQIVWGISSDKMIKKIGGEEMFMGGLQTPANPPDYHCKKCGAEFNLGVEGLRIECDTYPMYDYIKYKIRQITYQLKNGSVAYIKSRKTLKKKLKGFDDEEFDAFINHLKDLNHIYEPREGYIKLTGYEDFECVTEYPD